MSRIGETKDGLELVVTLAGEMEAVLEVATASSVTVTNVFAAGAFVVGVITLLAGDDEHVNESLARLESQIADLKIVTDRLRERLNDVVVHIADESNRNTLRFLREHLDDVKTQASDLLRDADPPAAIAARCGIIADKFLADDFDIWRWTDVVKVVERDPVSEEERVEYHAIPGQFKNVPTLPIYIMAVLVWLAARERAVAMGQSDQVESEIPKLRWHLAKLASRPEYDQFGDDRDGPPRSIAEHIKYQIHSYINAATRYPQAGVCRFSITVHNWMTGLKFPGETFERRADNPSALCMIDPRTVDTSETERALEAKAGITVLDYLEGILRRVLTTGTLKELDIGFDPAFFDLNHLYAMAPNGDLYWYSHVVTRRTQVTHGWGGPKRIARGWRRFVDAYPAGYRGIYTLTRTGGLIWYRHDGFMYGTDEWQTSVDVSAVFDRYSKIIPCADGVLYGVTPDGELFWHRHRGYDDGTPGWEGPRLVRDQWERYDYTFSAGLGILYGVERGGEMSWRRHLGYLDGRDEWTETTTVASGWDMFRRIFSAGVNTIYAVARDGTLYWYQHEGYLDGSNRWVGPVRLTTGWDQFRILFARMSGTPPAGGGIN